jgi:alkaline phosphatase D
MKHPESITNILQQAAGGAAIASRRHFVRGLGASALALPLVGCGGSGDDPIAVEFRHGVASGDPLGDRIVLWTRVTPPQGHAADLDVDWELALDADFKTMAASGKGLARATQDFTFKVDVTGLKPATRYHYRFRSQGVISATGRTRTLPVGAVQQVRLAVFSCANYPAGYFNVYAHAARQGDFDATVHLGDYIYEYARGGYANGQAEALQRQSLPANEIVSLADYRQRHAQYKGDADLQALHAAAPMIAVWDDHEISNDTWMHGAENHQPATEGDFELRKMAALKAYHEWMPTRNAQPEIIYRSFAFGDLLALHMLDTRVIGRDQQLDYANYFTAQGLDAARFTADMSNPARQLMGATQTQWLGQQLAASQATWQVLGQQVLMGRMELPAPLLMDILNPGSGVSLQAYAALLAKAQANPAALTAAEKAVLAQPRIPYNLDAWDGYAVARETVLATARSLGKNLVVLAGDTHNAWASELRDRSGQAVGVEFATSSVSSPGFEEYLSAQDPAQLRAALLQFIEPLKYCDTSRRGYMVVTATPQACQAEWVYVDTVRSRQFQAVRDAAWKVVAGQPGRLVAA